MASEREAQAGMLSGLVAVVMVVALSAMAFGALQPAREPPLRTAEIKVMPSPPTLPLTIPGTGQFIPN